MTTHSDQLDAAFRALAHPTRRAILARLAHGTATVNELAEPFDATLPAISKHIRVLEDAGLLERKKEAQFRHCKLTPQPISEIAEWTDQYRSIWEARFDALSGALQEMRDRGNE